MERCLTSLRTNTFGIIAEVAKQSQKTNVADVDSSGKSDTSSKENRHFSNIINVSRRNIKGPFTNPPRPNIDVTRIDWPRHKYVCFPMPKLATSDSQEIGLVDNTIFVPRLLVNHCVQAKVELG